MIPSRKDWVIAKEFFNSIPRFCVGEHPTQLAIIRFQTSESNMWMIQHCGNGSPNHVSVKSPLDQHLDTSSLE